MNRRRTILVGFVLLLVGRKPQVSKENSFFSGRQAGVETPGGVGSRDVGGTQPLGFDRGMQSRQPLYRKKKTKAERWPEMIFCRAFRKRSSD
jgi:hypothetical protein